MAVAFIAKYLFESHLYLSTLFQSKLRRITTGGAPRLASGGWIVPDRQGEVSTQHNPSAESENATIGEVKYSPQARRAKNKHKVAKFAWTTQHLTALANIQSKLIYVSRVLHYFSNYHNRFSSLCTQQCLSNMQVVSHFPLCSKNILSVEEIYIDAETLITNTSILRTWNCIFVHLSVCGFWSSLVLICVCVCPYTWWVCLLSHMWTKGLWESNIFTYLLTRIMIDHIFKALESETWGDVVPAVVKSEDTIVLYTPVPHWERIQTWGCDTHRMLWRQAFNNDINLETRPYD